MSQRESHSVIKLDGVTHRFEKNNEQVKVLAGIELSVQENEFVAIIGPSGCGKSTLLYIVAGFIKPTDGTVFHRGKPIEGPSAQRGIVFQADAVFPWLTVSGNIEFGLKALGMERSQRQQTIRHYIELVELKGSENLFPKQLSGGMRKRVDVARTYAINPDVLLMDESFGSLDAQTKENLQIELLNIWSRERKTALFVTHDIEEAIFLADVIYLMTPSPGKIQEIIKVPFGRPRDVSLKFDSKFSDLRQYLVNRLGTQQRN